VPTFLLESYRDGVDRDWAVEVLTRLRAVADQGGSSAVTPVGSIVVADDGMAFFALDGPSEQEVRRAADRAGLAVDRITTSAIVLL
jgi:hypothetical protein